jgi:NADH/NAD ratio-sensing transcriptional regulator Rex
VDVKFDLLNRELLENVIKYKCKILHLSSTVFDSERLCVEGEYGEIEYLSSEDIKSIFSSKDERLDVDVLVLAIPESTKIAQTFINLGVDHVIAFDFEQFVKHDALIPKLYDFIYNFCITFYKELLSSMTVE